MGDLLQSAEVTRAQRDLAETIGAGDPARAELRMREHLADLIRLVEQERPGLSDSVIDWMR